jgi:polyhydroxyalkanoate synthesis regulator phasin
LGPLLQGVTLASVFAIGAWTGKIDSKLDEVLHAQEQQRSDMKELAAQVAKLNENLSYL